MNKYTPSWTSTCTSFFWYFGGSRYIHGNPQGKEQPLWWWDLHGNSEVTVDVCYRTIVNPSFFFVGYSKINYPYPKSLQLAVMTCVYSWTDMGKPMEQVFQSWLFWATSGAPFTEVSLESRIRKRKSRMILCRPGAPGLRAGWTSETTVLQSWHTFIFAGNQCFFSGSLWCSLVMLSSMNIFF